MPSWKNYIKGKRNNMAQALTIIIFYIGCFFVGIMIGTWVGKLFNFIKGIIK